MSKIILLTDGKAGHATQAIGIAKLLNPQQDSALIQLNIKHPAKLIKQLFKQFYTLFPKQWMLHFFIEEHQLNELLQSSDLTFIVSAGGDTLLPNALLKELCIQRGHKLKNVIATSLRGMSASYYDAVFTIDQTKKNTPPYVYYPIAPNKLVSFDLTAEQYEAKQKLGLLQNQSCISILIGADTQDVKIGSVEDWINLITDLAHHCADQHIFVSTSRRTAAAFEQALKSHLQFNNVELILVGEGNQTPIQNLIYAAEIVLCSPDSTSMVSEALIAEKKLLIPMFENTVLNPKFEHYYQTMQAYLSLSPVQTLKKDMDASQHTQEPQHVAALVKIFSHLHDV